MKITINSGHDHDKSYIEFQELLDSSMIDIKAIIFDDDDDDHAFSIMVPKSQLVSALQAITSI